MKASTSAALLVVLLLTSGCAGVFESDREAIRTYTLAPPARTATEDASARFIRLGDVTAAPGLDTDRILLRQDSLRLDYFAGARWAAPSPALVEDYLQAVLRSGPESLRLADTNEAYDYELDLQLRTFEADYRGGEPPRIDVSIVAVLRDRGTTRTTLLIGDRLPAADNTLGSVAEAFDAAMAKVVADLVKEIDAEISSSAGSR